MWKVDLLSHFREQGLCGSACPSQTSFLSPSRELHTLSLLCQLPAGVAHLWLLHHEGKKIIASESGGPFTQVKLFSHEGQNSLNENWGRGRGPFTREELSVETHALFAMEVRIHYMRIGGVRVRWGAIYSSKTFCGKLRLLHLEDQNSLTEKLGAIYASKTVRGKLSLLHLEGQSSLTEN